MPNEKYRALIDAICDKTRIGDPVEMYEEAHIGVDATNFTLASGGERSPDTLVMYADFGLLPTQSREVAMLRLMESNLLMSGGTYSPAFALNPDTQAVLLIVNLPLATATADSVLHTMGEYAVMAANWSVGYFMTEKEFKHGALASGQAGSSQGRQSRLRERL